MFQFKSPPLERMRQTQPFGVDYVGDGFYRKLGLKAHNGWDLSAITGTKILAVADGLAEFFTDGGYGKNIRLTVDVDAETRLEVVYGHLQEATKTGQVHAGDAIALSNNTGLSTAPHLHLGVRIRKAPDWKIENYDNGYFGYVDPGIFYPASIFELPVDRRYGKKTGFITEAEFYPSHLWFFRTFKRLMTVRERNAFIYGAWDVRTVLDPAMFPIWSEFDKITAKVKGIV